MKNLLLIGLICSVALLAGCNTVSGAGKDVKAVGDKVEEVAEDARKKIKD